MFFVLNKLISTFCAFIVLCFQGDVFKWLPSRVIERDKAIHYNGFDEEHLKVPLLEDDVKRFSLPLLLDWPEAMHSQRNAAWKVSNQGGLGKRHLISSEEARLGDFAGGKLRFTLSIPSSSSWGLTLICSDEPWQSLHCYLFFQ